MHTLEHGRINIQYKPGTPATTVARLETLVKELDDGYHILLYENTTKMPFAVAATAWDHQLGCNTMNDKVFDAHPRLPHGVHRQGPRSRPVGASRASLPSRRDRGRDR